MAPMLGSLIQLPVIMSCFMGIRKLCETVPAVRTPTPLASLAETGGALWFPNLAVPDPVFALPVLAGLTTLFMTELGADGMNANGQVGMKYMMRGMSIFTVFVAAKMSSVVLSSPPHTQGLCLYWIANATFAGVQTLCINPAARSTLKRWLTFSRKEDAVPPPPVAPVKPVKPAKHVPTTTQDHASNANNTIKEGNNANNKENVDSLLEDVKSSVFKKYSVWNKRKLPVDDLQRVGLHDGAPPQQPRLADQHEAHRQLLVHEHDARCVLLHAAVVGRGKHRHQLAVEGEAVAVAALVSAHDQIEIESRHELLHNVRPEEIGAVTRRRNVPLDVGAGIGPEEIGEQAVHGNGTGPLDILDNLHGGQIARQSAVNATTHQHGGRGTQYLVGNDGRDRQTVEQHLKVFI